MTEQEQDRRGTIGDWPARWVLAGIALLLLGVVTQGSGLVALGWVLVIFGGISTAIRRGAFSPRPRP